MATNPRLQESRYGPEPPGWPPIEIWLLFTAWSAAVCPWPRRSVDLSFRGPIMSTRREARTRVMQALYAHEQAGGDVDHFVETLFQPIFQGDAQTFEFAEELFRATVDAQKEADEIIQTHATNWDLHRITAIDRALLRMATTELLKFPDIPPKVSIDEAIEIAKVYSTPESGPFINGVLDAVLMDLHDQDRLEKAGRGQIGMESIRRRADS